MTVATMQRELTGLRQDIQALTALVKERLPAPALPVFDADRVFVAEFPTLGPLRTASGDGVSDDGVWWVERKEPDRVSVVPHAVRGGYCLRLHTEPGDSGVSGSLASERADVALTKNAAGYADKEHWGLNGQVQWWAHSILLPDDFYVAPDGWTAIFGFHDDRNQGGQGNFHIFASPSGLSFRGHAGPEVVQDGAGNQFSYGGEIVAPLIRNAWIDFAYHVKWSWGADGYFDAWVNGVEKLRHQGPTLYQDYGVYLKLANYHSAHGKPSSVLHDRVIRGKTWQSVSLPA